jgi:protoporphyrinogen oxidase
MAKDPIAIIGAGPAGLTAAYLLAKDGWPVTVLEGDPTYVGGISRTATYKGFLFDIGGHRFFSKSKEVEDLWTELLPDDMLVRPRLSRIYYRGKFFSYPLKGREAFLKLGVWESFLCGLSYVKARLFPVRNPASFEDWVSNRFGERLFRTFFKTYTEKVWGMSCKEISADWAAQRIKGLSLTTAVLSAIWPKRGRKKGDEVVKTLINSFRYPRRGPGMIWEAAAARIREFGGRIEMGRRVSGCAWDAASGEWTVTTSTAAGAQEQIKARHVVSTAPMRELMEMLTPAPSAAAREAGSKLKYRDFLTVVLILKERGTLADNWVYIHDPSVYVGRIQNFRSWSPEMVPDPALACYGLEYFCFEHDGLWNTSDEQLIALGTKELLALGLAQPGDVQDGCVVRQRKAYPVYDDDYARHVAEIRADLEARYPTLHLIGRNGMHRYNNQDHSMMTAMLCVKNIEAGERRYDLWEVNEDAEYHEKGESHAGASGLRGVPERLPAEAGTRKPR